MAALRIGDLAVDLSHVLVELQWLTAPTAQIRLWHSKHDTRSVSEEGARAFASSPVRDERRPGSFVQGVFCAPAAGEESVTFVTNTAGMGATDDELDATSRRLLKEVDDLKRLEVEKRETARSSDEFHDLTEEIEIAARHVFDSAGAELIEGLQDSPRPDERDEQHPGDWAEGVTR
jgi:hypothetical protein